MSAEAVFEAANASGHYVAHYQKTGFQLRLRGKAVGGWECRRRHWYILNPFASSVAHYRDVLRRQGFEQQGGHLWWRLRGEANAHRFQRALEDLTGCRFDPKMPADCR